MSACSRLSSCNLMMQVSYAIGVAQPLSVHVDTYGTGNIPTRRSSRLSSRTSTSALVSMCYIA